MSDMREMQGLASRKKAYQEAQVNPAPYPYNINAAEQGPVPSAALQGISFLLSDLISAASAEAVELREIADRAFGHEPPDGPRGGGEILGSPVGTVAEITQKIDTLRGLLGTVCHHRTRLQQLT